MTSLNIRKIGTGVEALLIGSRARRLGTFTQTNGQRQVVSVKW
jgi:hypothetical protein